MRLFLASFCVLTSVFVNAQVGPRGWQEHIGINSPNSVTKNGRIVYASNSASIVYFDEEEKAPRALSKINGLSDVGVRLLRTNPFNNKVLVAYDNCNLDIISNKTTVTNYPDFKLKSLNGKKLINEISFSGNLAYLACGFGIVVFDMERLEIRDTYIIGPGASELEVYQVQLNDSLIFAATPDGIYFSNYKTKILNNYQNWNRVSDLPIGPYHGLVNVAGLMIAAYTPSSTDPTNAGKDSLYALYPDNVWDKYPKSLNTGDSYIRLGATYKTFFTIIDATTVRVIDAATGQNVNNLSSFNGQTDYGTLRDVYFDKDYTGNVAYWICDATFGLYRTLYFYPYDIQVKLSKNGTNSTQIGAMDCYRGKLALAPSLIGNAGVGNYSTEGLNLYEKGVWTYMPIVNETGKARLDVTSVLYDRTDDTKMWVSTWGDGIIQYENNEVKKVFGPSTLPGMSLYLDNLPRCSGLSMDKDGNVFFAQSDQKGYLSVITKDGNYQNIPFETGKFTRKTFVDKNGNVWLLHERDGGITVLKPTIKNGIVATPLKDNTYRALDNSPGTGNLQSMGVFSIAEDLDGRIWIGTTAGISVFYNPTALFNSNSYDSQPIKIVQDGNVELLLGKETVTSIVVDGANNKWCGTQQGGVYCFSADGQQQLYHFTKENSPLYSNTIIDLSYDASSGDLFIGTEVGLQSFRSTIVEGAANYNAVHAYPNPVKPGYSGSVQITGLLDESIVKIADESGNLVWETKSAGGQVEWPVKTLSGQRVTSGVYLVYAATPNGDFKTVSKILVVN